jgi:hypothetical protein
MAYKMSDVGSWGTGALGDITNPSGQVNSYANVTAISTNTVTIGTPSNGIYETFAVGKEILLHVSAITSGTDYQYLGKYMVATITGVAGSVLTLSKDVSGLIASGVLANHHVQAITVTQFATLNLTATIAPLAYNATNKYGGIIAFKCKSALNLSGSGKIDLAAKGIPIASIALRPATAQEGTAAQIGWENHITARQFYLNCPDGAAFIAAKALANTGTSTRIGGATAGVALYPYNGGSTSNTNAKGGPSILVAAQTITGFAVDMISKASSNTNGRGIGRCYIATETKLPADEFLYSLDCLSNPARLVPMGIKDYGSGALGTVTSLSGQINSYANVTAISADGRTLTIGTKYEGVYEKFEAGNRVMFHVSRQSGSDQASIGKLILTKILSVAGNTVMLDTPVTNVVPTNVLSNYKCQLITIAQFDTLAWSGDYTGAKAYNDTHGCGGILAIQAKTVADLQGGKLNMVGKGIPSGVSRPAVTWQSSGSQGDVLPLSSGNGAILLIAKRLVFNASTRLGATWSGAVVGSVAGGPAATAFSTAGSPGNPGGAGYPGSGAGGGACNSGYPAVAGSPGFITPGFGGRGGFYTYWDEDQTIMYPTPGPGGTVNTSKGMSGNPGANGGQDATGTGSVGYGGAAGYGGSSLFIVADTIVGFIVDALSIGGGAGFPGGGGTPTGARSGGGGGGGGKEGTGFIYANNVETPDFTAYLAS